ncbi:MAG TPA: GNAT family N-acetyltransferase, partial [Bacteroidota bacterium]|nr:GNAT family N-acetyltransferase [Bacteroidota bacterium]
MIEIIDHVEGIRQLATEWNRLASRFESPLVQHEWFLSCAEAFCPPDTLKVVVLRKNGAVRAIAPLAVVGHGVHKRLELLGTGVLCEPSSFLYEDHDALMEIVDAIKDFHEPTILKRLISFSNESNMIGDRWKSLQWIQMKTCTASPWLPINSPWKDFEKSISSQRRYTLRRARKRSEEMGQLEISIISPDEHSVERYLEELFRIEASGWKHREGTSLQMNCQLRNFFQRYSFVLARQKKLRFGILRIGDRAVAAQLAVEFAGRYWVLKIGFDEEYARCSPGILLMHESVRYAFEKGLQAFEFLGSDELWLQMWTDQTHRFVTYRSYPVTFHGFVG